MDEQILRLCKRLKNFTLEEVEPILNIENLENILQKFVAENALSFQRGKYFYNKRQKEQVRLPLFFQCHSPQAINLIIKCFCAEIPFTKIIFLTDNTEEVLYKFNKFFRKIIFEKQKNQLLHFYEKSPKSPWKREFYGNIFYFYNYENSFYISENRLISISEKMYKKAEYLEFKRVYSFIRRKYDSHNGHKFNSEWHLAEFLWRRNKSFEQLKNELSENLGFNC